MGGVFFYGLFSLGVKRFEGLPSLIQLVASPFDLIQETLLGAIGHLGLQAFGNLHLLPQ